MILSQQTEMAEPTAICPSPAYSKRLGEDRFMKKHCFLAVLCGLFVCCAPPDPEYDRPQYLAWKKMHAESVLEFEDWRRLYHHSLLPEQRPITAQ